MSIVNGGRKLASGCPGAGSVPHAQSRRLDVLVWVKWKSQLFIELDVEGDWVHQIKQLRVDKGKGQMGTADLEPDDEEAWAQYRADVHHLAELSKVIAHSFEALVLLLVEWLPVPMSGNLGSVGLDEEETENAEG